MYRKGIYKIAFLVVLVVLGIFLSYVFTPKQDKVDTQITAQSNSSPSPQVMGEQLAQNNTSATDIEDTIRVTRVIDGDTVEIESGQKVRYIGIDTPETAHPTKGVECFGKEATAKNRQLAEGQLVRLEKDISETDKYGRLLRYVWVGETMVNDYLVRQGFAHSSTYPPDVKYQNQFTEAQQEARENNRGLWAQCKTGTVQTVSDSGCIIKGNISSSGERIYHVPGQRYYEKTVIDETKGERWFCTEEDAISAGWRKSKI